ncbi:hypothetical protein TNCV_4599551 [Trichonephila clavipes]|nr:hypothetical protein TNCV_4599551 [Trichonephila clavipes]
MKKLQVDTLKQCKEDRDHLITLAPVNQKDRMLKPLLINISLRPRTLKGLEGDDDEEEKINSPHWKINSRRSSTLP